MNPILVLLFSNQKVEHISEVYMDAYFPFSKQE